ncbi:hypothetical protein [Desulforhopalus sp. IMCC35007]|uniref:hypothetical protein n=1 Tax=Desulforhopalus sp. IMCC35007 TaxID=2569543 RepID=UPI0010ADD719|nr:hypothetical protein [Desulforhopalus sp. IMCC35007]TKB07128.1 hypothetical protein FCL48_17940 [Desulforhopalus sp. IMCC35007]
MKNLILFDLRPKSSDYVSHQYPTRNTIALVCSGAFDPAVQGLFGGRCTDIYQEAFTIELVFRSCVEGVIFAVVYTVVFKNIRGPDKNVTQA